MSSVKKLLLNEKAYEEITSKLELGVPKSRAFRDTLGHKIFGEVSRPSIARLIDLYNDLDMDAPAEELKIFLPKKMDTKKLSKALNQAKEEGLEVSGIIYRLHNILKDTPYAFYTKLNLYNYAVACNLIENSKTVREAVKRALFSSKLYEKSKKKFVGIHPIGYWR